MVDLIVDRREMKAALAKAFRFMGQRPVERAEPVPAAVAEP
jgi:acetyl-CoA carboxylase beta subunit